MKLWNKLKCIVGKHNLQWIQPIDEQWVLYRCTHCRKEYEHRFRVGTIRPHKSMFK